MNLNGVARRSIVEILADRVYCCQFSLTNMLLHSPLLQNLTGNNDSSHKKILARLAKMASVLDMLRGTTGFVVHQTMPLASSSRPKTDNFFGQDHSMISEPNRLAPKTPELITLHATLGPIDWGVMSGPKLEGPNDNEDNDEDPRYRQWSQPLPREGGPTAIVIPGIPGQRQPHVISSGVPAVQSASSTTARPVPTVPAQSTPAQPPTPMIRFVRHFSDGSRRETTVFSDGSRRITTYRPDGTVRREVSITPWGSREIRTINGDGTVETVYEDPTGVRITVVSRPDGTTISTRQENPASVTIPAPRGHILSEEIDRVDYGDSSSELRHPSQIRSTIRFSDGSVRYEWRDISGRDLSRTRTELPDGTWVGERWHSDGRSSVEIHYPDGTRVNIERDRSGRTTSVVVTRPSR